jgi:hypothetical protein
MDLSDVPAGDGERASQGREGGIRGEEREANRRRQQCAGILAARRRRCGARQEATDVAEADEITRPRTPNATGSTT